MKEITVKFRRVKERLQKQQNTERRKTRTYEAKQIWMQARKSTESHMIEILSSFST